MTDYSQNGWTAPGRSVIVTMSVPGTAVKLPVRAGPAGQLLVAAAARWNAEVEPLIPGACWGYADRTVRGSATDLSNHASGTAIDLNAPQHPLGTAPAANFTAAEIGAVRRIVASFAPCLRWGGDYTGRKDGMHLEIVASEQQCAAVLGSPRPNPSPTPRPSEEDDLTPDQANQLALLVSQLVVGPDPAAKAWGWPTFGGGTNEKLTVVDYLRRTNQQLQNLAAQVSALETGKTPIAGPAVLTSGDLDAIAERVVKLLGAKASA